MGYLELALNITMIMFLVNASLFITIAGSDSTVYACLSRINPSLASYSPSTNVANVPEFCLPQASSQSTTIVGSSSTADLPDAALSLIAGVFTSFGGTITDFIDYIKIIFYVIGSVLFLGWTTVYETLFVGIPELSPLFFMIGIAITAIQLFGTVYLGFLLLGRLKGTG